MPIKFRAEAAAIPAAVIPEVAAAILKTLSAKAVHLNALIQIPSPIKTLNPIQILNPIVPIQIPATVPIAEMTVRAETGTK